MQKIKIKMTNQEVVQRVLDFWDPLSTSLFSGGSIGQIDEYDRYAVEACELLGDNSNEVILREYLNHILFDRIGLKRTEESVAKNRFYAWSLRQVWETQQRVDSNSRLTDSNLREISANGKKQVSPLRLVQMYLEDWDPKKVADDWLCGADTINSYDEAAFEIVKLLQMQSKPDVIAEAFGWIALSQGHSIGFFLENHHLPDVEVRSLSVEKVKADSQKYRSVITNLLISFPYFDKCPPRCFSG